MLANRFYERNIGKRKFYLFKQYINGMLSSKSSVVEFQVEFQVERLATPSRQHSSLLDIRRAMYNEMSRAFGRGIIEGNMQKSTQGTTVWKRRA